MLRLDPDSESPEKPCKGTDYLHRVLGLREYAVVILENQANAFFLEPFPYILIAEGRERKLKLFLQNMLVMLLNCLRNVSKMVCISLLQ